MNEETFHILHANAAFTRFKSNNLSARQSVFLVPLFLPVESYFTVDVIIRLEFSLGQKGRKKEESQVKSKSTSLRRSAPPLFFRLQANQRKALLVLLVLSLTPHSGSFVVVARSFVSFRRAAKEALG